MRAGSYGSDPVLEKSQRVRTGPFNKRGFVEPPLLIFLTPCCFRCLHRAQVVTPQQRLLCLSLQ